MAKKTETRSMDIPAMKMERMTVTLIGESPLIVHRFAQKAKTEMLDKQRKKAKAGREAKDPLADFNESQYRLADGTHGFPVIAFKAAAVTACTSISGMTKVAARQAFMVTGEQVSVAGAFEGSLSSTELVPIYGPPPNIREDMVRVGMGTADLRYRAEYWPYAIELTVVFNTGALSAEQVLNLFNVAGFGVGVGEWRPERDGQNGRFRIATEADDKLVEILKAGKAPGPVAVGKAA